jgi:hypothetical protein
MVKVENIKSQSPLKFSMKNNKFLYLVMAGFLGTLAFYVAAYVDMAVTGVPLDISVVLGQLIAGEHESAYIIGNVAHIGNGIGLTLFFGYVFLPISTKIMKGRIWIHGIIFGIIVTVTTVWFGLLPALGRISICCNSYNCGSMVCNVASTRCRHRRTKHCTRSSSNDYVSTYCIWFGNWNYSKE